MTIKKRSPTELDIKIGETIEIYRKIKKKTRPQLGEAVGVCYQQIAKYENGISQISLDMLLKIAKALKVKFIDLLPKELLDNKINLNK